ncbi:PRC-barrel domain protein [Methanobrevibacter cuticularis]|uniref:PRC-barrel domain protein n=1 Tax=Methanobrevibacter cuticularis TaxID=47311 RepID=A0A166CZ49_9EURY|nr:PRC-barrel domain-containing protein [Methanobrevibacter cuticularis]KZX17657.1 PRC-barrel domain protein [Methanobrevibacter cuticularis]
MDINKLFDMEIVDKDGKSVGKVQSIDIDEDDGSINSFGINPHTSKLHHGKDAVDFDQVNIISNNILLKNSMEND